MIDIPRNPRPRDLTVFGVLLPPFVAFLAWLAWRHVGETAAYGVAGAGGLLWLVFVAVPPARRRIWVGWMLAVFPIGFIVSHVILAVVYFLVVTPVGLALRIAGRDALVLRPPAGEESAWVERRPAEDESRYFRQF